MPLGLPSSPIPDSTAPLQLDFASSLTVALVFHLSCQFSSGVSWPALLFSPQLPFPPRTSWEGESSCPQNWKGFQPQLQGMLDGLTSFLVAFDREDLGASAATLGSLPLSLLGEVTLGEDVAASAASVFPPLLGTAGKVTSSRFTKGFT